MNLLQVSILSASIIVASMALGTAQPKVSGLSVSGTQFSVLKSGVGASHAYIASADGRAWACSAYGTNGEIDDSSCRRLNLP
jgi:hypothetical protein